MKEKIVKLDVIKIKYYFVKDTIKIISEIGNRKPIEKISEARVDFFLKRQKKKDKSLG